MAEIIFDVMKAEAVEGNGFFRLLVVQFLLWFVVRVVREICFVTFVFFLFRIIMCLGIFLLLLYKIFLGR